MKKYRNDFSIFKNREVVYLDNSATMQRPDRVLNAVDEFYKNHNANPFRGVYDLSEECTEMYEEARDTVAKFINASSSKEIIFTRNASESLNLVAYSYGLSNFKAGDEIVVSVMEHHSNFLPWKMVCEMTGATLVKLEPDEDGYLSLDKVKEVLSDKTKLVALTQVSNVLGRVNDIKNIAKLVHEKNAVIVVDGAQSVPHMRVDVRELDADFLAFSGHKLMAPLGIGVLYGKEELLDAMPPFMQGGEMIEIVHWDRVRYASLPHKFEAGTVNVGGAVGLKAAIDYINEIGFDAIMKQEEMLTKMCMDGMKEIPHVNIIGGKDASEHLGIVTFTIDDVHPHDIATIFNSEGIAVRAGHHCAQPLMDFLKVGSTTRASFAFYNNEEDVNEFLRVLKNIRSQMGY